MENPDQPFGQGRAGAVLLLLLLVLLGAAVGVIAALLGLGFVSLIRWLNDLLAISPRARMLFQPGEWLPAVTIAVPAIGGLVVGLLHLWIPGGRPHTPADVIAAVQTRRGRLPARAGVLTACSSLVSLGSGASVGQYGPLVHIGATLGSLVARALRAGRSADNIAIAAGVAAVIATAFNAPLAGIVFAHEVVLRHYALRAFAPVAAAGIVGHVLADVVFDRDALFHVAETGVPQVWEFGAFLLIGALGALVAGAYMHAILGVGRISERLPVPAPLQPAIAGALLGLTALWVPDILGIGEETLRLATIDGAFGPWELALVLVLKLMATALCLGMGFSGGVFSPALVVGTLFGALCGTVIGGLTDAQGATLAVYAVCGMVAVTAPVIGAPLTSLLIVFELTGNYVLAMAALASIALANPVGAQMFGRSLFDIQLKQSGLDLSSGRSRAMLEGMRVLPYLSRACVRLRPEISLREAVTTMSHADHGEAYLVDDHQRYRGTVTLARLAAAAEDGAAAESAVDYVDPGRPVLPQTASVWEAMGELQHFAGEAIAVVEDRRSQRFLGVIYESALTRAYLDKTEELRREEYGSG
ncbi:chloride channel protein [Aquisalimonas sp. 2447]|uniref:chloride channel protein n=1 Tax=Aquisalimonas sp. 2447 TaxID=2740807 RepID=UPI00143270F8|nr:chloride channel protein [Aquisalimonas sp. 2447]QIT53978.1 chloride channel protein [Aquisalimonas sp. 2447]